MKGWFIFILGLCLSLNSVGQPTGNNNSFSVQVNKQIQFYYTNANELLKDKVINDAFEISVYSPQNNCSIFANVVFTGASNSITSNQLALKFTRKTSVNANISSNGEVPLTQSSQLLFTQPQMSANNTSYSFYYDLLLHPPSTFTTPATYNFSIIFTMTQP